MSEIHAISVPTYESPEQFFEAQQKITSSCEAIQCIDLSKKPPLKYIFEVFFGVQSELRIEGRPDSYDIGLLSESTQKTSSFNLRCTNLYSPNKGRSFIDCTGYNKQGQQIYLLEENSNSWKETLSLPNQKSDFFTFTGQDKPKLFEKIIEQQIAPSLDNNAPTNAPTPTNPQINLLNVALAAVALIGTVYCIHKIHSIITNHGKGPEKEREKGAGPCNL